MAVYTVIWQALSEEFMITEVTMNKDPAYVTDAEWVQAAATVEYAEWEHKDALAAIAGILVNGYYVLAVIKGKPEFVE